MSEGLREQESRVRRPLLNLDAGSAANISHVHFFCVYQMLRDDRSSNSQSQKQWGNLGDLTDAHRRV